MLNLFNNIVFLNPWILGGLAALPVLWYLLRITPPAPRIITLPTARFLADLIPDEQTPSHTPWWILLLRLMIAALVFLALAGPVYNPSAQLEGAGPIRLVVDNGWAAAQTWDEEMKSAMETLAEAAREKREIYILTTAPESADGHPLAEGPVSAAQAESIMRGLKPLPWSADYAAAAKQITDSKPEKNVHSFWFSHGLDEGGFDKLSQVLQAQGGLTLITPAPERLPLLVRKPDKTESGKFQMEVAAASTATARRPVTLQAMGDNGQVIDQASTLVRPGPPSLLTFETPEKIRGEITQIRIADSAGVGAVYVLDSRYKKRSVGLIGPSGESDPKPFIEARFYIRRALEPFTTLSEDTPEEVLKADPSVIILPDVISLPPETLDALEQWVKSGGLLLRFAGPNMAQNTTQAFLLPTPLRSGGRALEGSLTWEKPQKLVPFPETSPFYGITIHEDITVRQQILAEPVADLEDKTWAQLEDGTPLITATPLDKGMLVMVHTSAAADWSDLPLSGVFVEILRRIASIAGGSQTANTHAAGLLDPIWVFDGLGVVKTPGSTVQPIPAAEFDTMMPQPKHPPGLYGRGGYNLALNTGDHVKALKGLENLPAGIALKNYNRSAELDLMPYILYAALILLLVDWVVMIVMAASLRPLLKFARLVPLLFILGAGTAQAATIDNDLKYADGLYLAYMQTGDPALDALSQQGLENLASVLNRRTSVEPDGVVPLNPETDTLIFFPFIYWPVSAAQEELSPAAIANIQDYLDHGGTILFDTRDGNSAESSIHGGTANAAHLASLTARLNIPALAPIPKKHVLLRSFYLLSDVPGRLSDGTLWVEKQSVGGRDNVSSVIIGANDWAGAWAEAGANQPFAGGTRKQELAFRFGVNITMYALTGNYKADQVHVNNILERLGQ